MFLVNYEIPVKGMSSWTVTFKTSLPPPPRPPGFNGFLPNPIARSVIFLKANRLLVAYLDHGIV
jgi:hypothetical protein